MDNIAHSLVGAALGEAGLKKKTGLAMATLIISANLPDLDALGLLVGENLAWRRGWTHGPVAALILPPMLAGAMIALDRWQARRGTRPESRPAVHGGWLLALAYIGWFTHPLLDFLNTYGIRLLMPFSDRWFYGDSLFIIDPWLWLALALGIWLSRRRRKKGGSGPGRPAMASLTIAALYAGAMGTSSLAAEHMTRQAAEAQGHGPVETVVASPVPLNPFRRDMIFATDRAYGFGTLDWTPVPKLRLEPQLMETHMTDPAIAEARRDKAAADFLYWSRLPFARIEDRPDGRMVRISDARYARGVTAGRFLVSVRLPPAGRNAAIGPADRPQTDQEQGEKGGEID